MPDITPVPLTDVALATSTAKTLVVSAGAGQVPTTPSTITYDSTSQTLSIGAVAAVPQVNYGTQGGTISSPTPQTLFTQQPVDTTSFGPWQTVSTGAFFTYNGSTIWDPVFHTGYNPNLDPAAPHRNDLPTITYSLEANYQDLNASGRLTCEAYVDYASPANDGPSRIQRRPWAFTLDQLTSSTRFAIDLGPPQSGFGFFEIKGGASLGGDFDILNAFTGTTAATSQINLLSPTSLIGGTFIVSGSTDAASGVVQFGSGAGADINRCIAGGGTDLQIGSTINRLLFLQTGAATILAQADLLITSNTLNVAAGTGGVQTAGLVNVAASGADGTYAEVWRTQIAGNLGTGNWRNSWESTVSSSPTQSGMRLKIATSQTTQAVVATFGGDLSTTLAGSLSVGGGAAVSKILPASALLDFPSIAANSESELTISVTGATAGAPVALGAPTGLEAGLIATARVSASGVVTVRVSNVTASPIDPASATYTVTVFNP